MEIKQILNNTYDNYSYILELDNGGAICIDPFDSDQILEKLTGELSLIINTHNHHDHIRGNKGLLEKTLAKVGSFKNGDIIELSENEELQVLRAKGHTIDHIVLIYREDKRNKAIFSGDTLFNAGVGNCNSGDPEVLFTTIKNIILPLADDVVVYPGHDYLFKNLEFAKVHDPNNLSVLEFLQKKIKFSSNMKTERVVNPFLRLFNQEKEDPKELFLKLREKRDKF